MLADTSMLHEMRPEIIGGTLAIEPDGTFTETIAFQRRGQRSRGREAGAAARGAVRARVDDGRGEVLRPPPPLVRVGLSGPDRPMSFDVPADAYLRFMGRWSEPLAGVFLESADVRVTGQVLDVGCGPGVLTAVLVDRYGAPAVAAVDPSPSVRRRHPGALPGAGRPAGRRRGAAVRRRHLRRRTRPARRALHDRPGGRPPRDGPGDQPGRCRRGLRVGPRRGRLAALALLVRGAATSTPRPRTRPSCRAPRRASSRRTPRRPGSHDIASSALTVSLRFESYDEWWAPYLLGVGPLGAYVATLEADHLPRAEGALPRAPAGRLRSSSPRSPGTCAPCAVTP